MNLPLFTDKIDYGDTDNYKQSQIFSILQYIDTHYKNGTLAEISSQINPTYLLCQSSA